MRIQGGTAGIISALDSGRLDPFSAWLPEESGFRRPSPTNLAKIKRRERSLARERAKRLAARSPF